MPGVGEDAPQAAEVEHIQAFFLCCIRCPGLATIEKCADDAGSVDSHVGGVVCFWFSQTRCEIFDILVAACPILFPMSVSREVVLVTVEPRWMKLLTVSSA